MANAWFEPPARNLRMSFNHLQTALLHHEDDDGERLATFLQRPRIERLRGSERPGCWLSLKTRTRTLHSFPLTLNIQCPRNAQQSPTLQPQEPSKYSLRAGKTPSRSPNPWREEHEGKPHGPSFLPVEMSRSAAGGYQKLVKFTSQSDTNLPQEKFVQSLGVLKLN